MIMYGLIQSPCVSTQSLTIIARTKVVSQRKRDSFHSRNQVASIGTSSYSDVQASLLE